MINTYTILEAKRDELAKKLARIEKKAQKYNVPFSVSYGEPYAVEVKRTDDFGEKRIEKYEVFDLTVDSEVVKKDGYTVIAHLEHSSNGNIVNAFNTKVQKEWIHLKPFCAHCNSNHNLKYTFIVSNGEEMKQVGRNCLKDYCGIDPQMIAAMNQFVGELDEYSPDNYDFSESIPCVYDSVYVLALAIDIVNEQGYRKTDEPGSNKIVLSDYIGENRRPSKEAQEKARQMEEVISDMPVETAVNAMLNNVQTRINCLYCKASDLGYFAYAPVAYDRYIEQIERQKQREAGTKAMRDNSSFVGTIGERATFDVKEARLLTSFSNYYGTTFLYRFIDNDDNVLIWFASTTLETENVRKIKATVKDHTEREGVKQTIITRVKVA